MSWLRRLRLSTAMLVATAWAAGCAPNPTGSSPGNQPGSGGAGGSPSPTPGRDMGTPDRDPPVNAPDAAGPTPDAAGPVQTDTSAQSDLSGPTVRLDGASNDPPRATDVAGAETGDPPAGRPLMVDRTNPRLHTFTFTPSTADPAASDRNLAQTALLDTRVAQIRGKLVVVLAGFNSGPGPAPLLQYAASQGFHAMTVAYKNDFNPSTQNDPAFFGNARWEAFDARDRTPMITVARPDCVEVRVAKAMAYLQTRDAGGDWAYYLGADGQVRWSDVIFAGHSHGASSAAAYGKLVRIDRAISMAGPRDTTPVTATWLSAPSATPIDRYYGFTGTGDSQYQDHLRAFMAMGYVGMPVNVGSAAPPYGGSRRLVYNGGHGDAIDCETYAAACRYMFGID